MTKTASVYTSLDDSEAAGRDLGVKVSAAFDGEPADAVILFASARFDHPVLLAALAESCKPGVLMGSSSAGEFTSGHRSEGTACALAIRSQDMIFAAGLGTGVRADRAKAASDVVARFQGLTRYDYPHRYALIMTDALAGHGDEVVDQLTLLTRGSYQFAGGGAGDDARFQRTHVFLGAEAHSDAVVGLEILSRKPVGIGVAHGWTPASELFRVTEAEGMRVIGLNGLPTVEAFAAHAHQTGQKFDADAPLPFFLHNILGIVGPGGYRLRVPLSLQKDGSVTCAAEIPTGALVHIMKATTQSSVDAAQNATHAALRNLGSERPKAALMFDCVATRLRMGDVFGIELESVMGLLGEAQLVGCNTYGQIARAEGQFGGFHNCTAVVMVLPS